MTSIKDIITKKRDGLPLTCAEIAHFVHEYTSGAIPDYQAAAFCMAIFLRGMDDSETVALTQAIAASGRQIDLAEFGLNTADKHSTGGVGDKTTLICSPIAAACGVNVAKLAGRGLGHTGGTIDKLSSIPGYNSLLTPSEFHDQVRSIGIAVAAQTEDIAPADRKLYALRDVTGTVESPPLIISSVMGKKIAAGAACIVLDVKYGSGAFIKSQEAAQTLANSMVDIGNACGRRMSAVVSSMDAPLGNAVGNALEVREAVDMLSGHATYDNPQIIYLRDLCITLAGRMIALAKNLSEEDGEAMARAALESGAALAKFREWIAAQGGDVSFIQRNDLPLAPLTAEVFAPYDGGVEFPFDTQKVGKAACALGAGRMVLTDTIDPGAGVYFSHGNGGVTAKLYSSCEAKLAQGVEILKTGL